MRSLRFLAVVILASCGIADAAGPGSRVPPATARADPADMTFEQYVREMTWPTYLVIVGSGKDLPALKIDAERIAKRLGRRFDMLDRVYDAREGLHATGEDDGFTGYYHRRDDTDSADKPYLSIEKSETYSGLKPGFYIIVVRICATPKEAQSDLAWCQCIVPDAYTKRTGIYYGCRH